MRNKLNITRFTILLKHCLALELRRWIITFKSTHYKNTTSGVKSFLRVTFVI